MADKPNLDKIKAEVAEALKTPACKKLIASKLELYEERKKIRAQHCMPVWAFCGYGRCGKDLGAAWLAANYANRYVGSVSLACAPIVATALGITPKEAFDSRHEDRMYWLEFLNEVRRSDPTLLVKLTLADNDMVAGIRSDVELEASLSRGVVDLSIWVDNPRVEVDPTVEYEACDCDITVCNGGSKATYFRKLRSLARTSGMPTSFCDFGL